MKCVAIGRSCDEFDKKWYKKISEINFKMEPVMIILRFWKMSEFQGFIFLPTMIVLLGYPIYGSDNLNYVSYTGNP